MSLREMQRALSLLIRLPERNRGHELDRFLAGFELDARESRQLRALAADDGVAKYGRSMRGTRWETIREKLSLTKTYLPDEFLESVWLGGFEPIGTRVRGTELVLSFLEFMISDPETSSSLETSWPPFIPDVLKFELAQLRFWKTVRDRRAAPEGSALEHGQFQCVALEHDVLEALRELSASDGAVVLEPAPRANIALILANPSGGMRYFEIDRDVERFLSGQLRGDLDAPSPLDCYEQLVELGICKAREGVDCGTANPSADA